MSGAPLELIRTGIRIMLSDRQSVIRPRQWSREGRWDMKK